VKPVDPQVSSAAPGRIAVGSALTFATARRVFEAGVACFLRDGGALLTVDCAAVPNADSAGLAVLIEWRRWARQQGRDLNFVNLPAQITAIARLSEVSELLADKAA
jgi:phospholipid transport system transporter-binding protein